MFPRIKPGKVKPLVMENTELMVDLHTRNPVSTIQLIIVRRHTSKNLLGGNKKDANKSGLAPCAMVFSSISIMQLRLTNPCMSLLVIVL